jgi:hypothetical protein
MLRSPASRRLLGTALALSAGTGIGLGAYSFGTAYGPDTPQVPRAGTAMTTATAPARPAESGEPAGTSAPASPAAPLTLDEATAVAVQAAPGRVVEWDEDHEPTGLRYDVTLLHDDGSTTDVEVDTVTGQITSINHDDDRD